MRLLSVYVDERLEGYSVGNCRGRHSDCYTTLAERRYKKPEVQAFRKVDVLSDLLLKYPNGKLPSPEQLQQTLLRTYSIQRDRVKLWYDFTIESFRAISEISGIPLHAPGPEARMATPQKNFKLPLPSGRSFEYSIEDGFTADDLDFLKSFFELMKTGLK